MKNLGKVTTPPVLVGSEDKASWDALVREHHSLGYKKLPDRRIKYIARVGDQPVAAASGRSTRPSACNGGV